MNCLNKKVSLSLTAVVLILLALFSVDLFDLSGAFISLSIVLFIVLDYSNIKIDKNAIYLILFSFFYFLSVYAFEGWSTSSFIKLAIAPWGCYLIGYNLKMQRNSMAVTRLSVILAIGFFIHGMLNLLYGIQLNGVDFDSHYRIAYDFWQNRQISVTTAALYYSPLALMCSGSIFFSKNRISRLLSFFAIALALFATLIYQNRSLIVAISITFIFNFVRFCKDNSIATKQKAKYLLLFFVALLLFIIVWVADFLEIRSFFESTNLFKRFSGGTLDRFRLWTSFIFGEAWKYPLGGSQAVLINDSQYVHNLWLDTFRRAGVIPFLFLVVFTVRAIKETRKFCKSNRDNSNESIGLVISLLLGIFLLFLTEPIIEANEYIFLFPIIIIGVLCRKNRDNPDSVLS